MICTARRSVRWTTAAPAYLFAFEHTPRTSSGRYPKLAHHASEIPFVFHVLNCTGCADPGYSTIAPSEAGLSASDANVAMMSAHKRGRGVIATFDADGLERAEAMRAKLTAENLLVELVPVLDGEGQPSDAKPAGAVEEK